MVVGIKDLVPDAIEINNGNPCCGLQNSLEYFLKEPFSF